MWCGEWEVRTKECEVPSGECGGVKYGGVKSGVWSLKCGVQSVTCGVQSVKCEVWWRVGSVKCGVRSVEWRV